MLKVTDLHVATLSTKLFVLLLNIGVMKRPKGSILNVLERIPCIHIWPASNEKGHSGISHSVDQDRPLYDVENFYYNKIVYIARSISAIDVMIVEKCRP